MTPTLAQLVALVTLTGLGLGTLRLVAWGLRRHGDDR